MITLVVSITNEEVYEERLKKSIQELLDNKKKFLLIRTDPELSLSASYNTIGKVMTKYVAFVHQDLTFLEPDGTFLEKAETFADEIGEKLGVAGFAGFSQRGTFVGYFVRYIPKRGIGGESKYFGKKYKGRTYGKSFAKPIEVQSVDDMFFMVRGEIWNKHKFDEQFGFHCFGMDYCLQMNQLGLKNYSFPLRAWDYSENSYTDEYKRKYGNEGKIMKDLLYPKWKGKVAWIRGKKIV